MKYKTHKQIDEDYIQKGIFSRGEIEKMNNQLEQIRLVLEKSQMSAIDFIKHKKGRLWFFIWDKILTLGFGRCLSAGFGNDGYIEKAKDFGWREDEWQTNKIREIKNDN